MAVGHKALFGGGFDSFSCGKSLTAGDCPETKAPGNHHLEEEVGKLTPGGQEGQRGNYKSK